MRAPAKTPPCRLTFTSYDSAGLAHGPGPDGVQVHVEGGAAGDVAEVVIEHRSPHRPQAWGRLLRVIEAGPDRVRHDGKAGHRCGGCAWSHLRISAQREAKTRRLEEVLAAVGEPREGRPALLIASAPPERGYRSRAKYVLGRRGDGVLLGGYRSRSHDLISTLGCPVVAPEVEQVAQALGRELGGQLDRWPIFDEASGRGLLRYAAIRANHAGEVLLTLVATAAPPASNVARLVAGLRERSARLVGVSLDINTSRGNAIFSGEPQPLWGDQSLEERYGRARVRLAGHAFGQVNRAVAADLYAFASGAALAPLQTGQQAPERCWDLFCGAGALTQHLAFGAGGGGEQVLGVERDAAAVRWAQDAAAARGLRCRFHAADANAMFAGVAPAARPDVVVLNPPRGGCQPTLLQGLVDAAVPRVIYVSCSPETLARDLLVLGAGGLCLVQLQGYDMLPLTPHVEAVAVLERTP